MAYCHSDHSCKTLFFFIKMNLEVWYAYWTPSQIISVSSGGYLSNKSLLIWRTKISFIYAWNEPADNIFWSNRSKIFTLCNCSSTISLHRVTVLYFMMLWLQMILIFLRLIWVNLASSPLFMHKATHLAVHRVYRYSSDPIGPIYY